MKEPAAIFSHDVGGRRVARTIRKDLNVVQSVRPDIVIVQLGTTDLSFRAPLLVLIPRTSSACCMLHMAFSLLCMLNYSPSFGDVVQQRRCHFE